MRDFDIVWETYKTHPEHVIRDIAIQINSIIILHPASQECELCNTQYKQTYMYFHLIFSMNPIHTIMGVYDDHVINQPKPYDRFIMSDKYVDHFIPPKRD